MIHCSVFRLGHPLGRRLAPVVVALATAAPLVGCGRQALVAVDALPVRRVVIYRNGIAYFERVGHVDQDEVRFKMRPSEVGDFLATLAVMERGGSSVRAAAFPLDAPADSTSEAASDDTQGSPPAPPTGDKSAAKN